MKPHHRFYQTIFIELALTSMIFKIVSLSDDHRYCNKWNSQRETILNIIELTAKSKRSSGTTDDVVSLTLRTSIGSTDAMVPFIAISVVYHRYYPAMFIQLMKPHHRFYQTIFIELALTSMIYKIVSLSDDHGYCNKWNHSNIRGHLKEIILNIIEVSVNSIKMVW
jgi:hypothetical protein